MIIYDKKIESWYNFSITKADDIIINASGLILIADGTYVVKYDETTSIDNQTGTAFQVLAYLKTRTITENDIRLSRSRYINMQYNKRSGEDVTITLTNPFNNEQKEYSDTTGSGEKLLRRLDTDAMTGSLKKFTKIYYEISGTGFEKLRSLEHIITEVLEGQSSAA